MGRSLDVTAIFGWSVGWSEDLEIAEEYLEESGYFDESEFNEKLSAIEIEGLSYYDETQYFLRVKSVATIRNWDAEPIKLKDLTDKDIFLLPRDFEEINADFKILEKLFNKKIEGPPTWFITPSYS